MRQWTQWSPLLVALAVSCLWRPAASVAGPAAEPMLRIEAGMHSAKLNAIATDRAGRYAVTASDDKTVRVWDVASGGLIRVLRPPIGDGNEGKLSAVAVTSDGDTVATAAWADSDSLQRCHVYLFDLKTGQLKRRLPDLPGGIHSLAFSADGRWLAAALGGRNGLRVWDWRANNAALADSKVKQKTYGVSWGVNNRLATTSADGRIRLYQVRADRLIELAQAQAPGGRQPQGIAFSPNGNELAVGYANSTRVDVLDSKRLTLKYQPSSAGAKNGNLSNVSWSADGRVLYAGGRWSHGDRFLIRRWSRSGRGKPIDVPTAGEPVMRLAALPASAGGGVLVGSSEPAWGVLDAAGSWRLKQASPIGNFNGAHTELKLSGNGHEVQFGFERLGKAPYRFALASRQLQAGADGALTPPRATGQPHAGADDDMTRRRTERAPTNKRRTRVVRLNSVRKPNKPVEKPQLRPSATGITALADDGGVVVGARKSVSRFDVDRKELWQRPVPGVVWGVNVPAAGKLVVVAYDDGTIRWHRLSDGQELLAFFPHADRKRWVLWTPTGYYDASPGGEDLIGWHLNRGVDTEADFFPASRLRNRFWRPDVIDLVLDTLDERRAVTAANAVRGVPEEVTSVAQTLPPVVELVSPAAVAASQPQLTLRYRTRSAADAPVTAVHVRVNGLVQPVARNLEVRATDDVRELTLSVPPQDSQVQLFAENRHGVSTPATMTIKWAGAAAARAAALTTADATGLHIQPKLYLLAIGVATYEHQDINKLSFAAKDARDFAQAMQDQQGKLYKTVEVKLVTEADATRDNIADALDWLQRQVTQHDVGMLFLSGHGYNDPSMGYTYLPVNADPDKLKRTGITMADIKSTLNSIPGKAVAFLDTCHSGNVFGPGQKSAFNDISG
ncbi:MAG: caspase family protein, partial [Burkholderiaceae bacterium]|nr:caspase family protein [Burkholderiaceae bacterium]